MSARWEGDGWNPLSLFSNALTSWPPTPLRARSEGTGQHREGEPRSALAPSRSIPSTSSGEEEKHKDRFEREDTSANLKGYTHTHPKGTPETERSRTRATWRLHPPPRSHFAAGIGSGAGCLPVAMDAGSCRQSRPPRCTGRPGGDWLRGGRGRSGRC